MFDSTGSSTATATDPALQIRMAVASLSGEDREHWLGSALSERLIELLETRERLDTEILRLVADWDRDRAWEVDGALSPKAWLTHRCPVTNTQAGRLVKQARLVDQHRVLSAALDDGVITTAHVDTISQVISKDREPLLEDHADVLVEQAKTLSLSDFRLVMRRWAVLADDQLAKDDYMKKWERRHLHISTGLDGWGHLDGFLDPQTTANLTATLDHLAPPDPKDTPDGPRSLPQRRADALCDLTSHYQNGGRPQGNPPTINTVIDIAGATGTTPKAAIARCAIEGIGPVTRSVLDQIGCDARYTHIIMAGESKILDIGRSKRDPTKAQRRAVIIRDRHCQFLGCRRKPQWCDIHHIDEWENGGPTNINNLILLCRRHHTLIHNSRWSIKRSADGGLEFIHPARGPRPRRRGRSIMWPEARLKGIRCGSALLSSALF